MSEPITRQQRYEQRRREEGWQIIRSRIDPDTAKALAAYGEYRGISPSEAVREALKIFFHKSS